jgi:hypothetical protein
MYNGYAVTWNDHVLAHHCVFHTRSNFCYFWNSSISMILKEV